MADYGRLGDEGGVCRCRNCSGLIAYGRGDLTAATVHFEADLAWRRDRGMVANPHGPPQPPWPRRLRSRGPPCSRRLLAEGLSRWEQDGGANREGLAECLAAVARLAACCGHPATAASLYGASEACSMRSVNRWSCHPAPSTAGTSQPWGHPWCRGFRRNLGGWPRAAAGGGDRGSAGR